MTGAAGGSPASLHPAERRRERRRRDTAYAAYLYIGSMLALGFVLRWVPASLPGYWHLGSFLAYPALVLAVPAGLLGLAYTVVVRREPTLWILAAFVLAVAPVLAVMRALPPGWGALGGLFFGALTILSLGLPLAWFARRRGSWSRLSESEARTELERGW